MLINVKLIGGVDYILYICITLPVDNPDGGATRVGESGLRPDLYKNINVFLLVWNISQSVLQ
jgi:hypothetical protein